MTPFHGRVDTGMAISVRSRLLRKAVMSDSPRLTDPGPPACGQRCVCKANGVTVEGKHLLLTVQPFVSFSDLTKQMALMSRRQGVFVCLFGAKQGISSSFFEQIKGGPSSVIGEKLLGTVYRSRRDIR